MSFNLEIALWVAAGVFLVVFCIVVQYRIYRPFRKFPSSLWELNYDEGLEDPQLAKAAAVVAGWESTQAAAQEAVVNVARLRFKGAIDTFLKLPEVSGALYKLFKHHYIEFNDESEREPYMFSFTQMPWCEVLNTKENLRNNGRTWLLETKTFHCFLNVNNVELELFVTHDGKVGLGLANWGYDFDPHYGLRTFIKELNSSAKPEEFVVALIEQVKTMLENLATKSKHVNDGNVWAGSFEAVMLCFDEESDVAAYHGSDRFLLNYNRGGLSPSNAFFDPLAFGQVVLEGGFAIDELETADVHGYFEFEIGFSDYVVGEVIDVFITSNDKRVLLATTAHRASFDVPEAFEELSLSEFMFYYHQLGLLVKGLFIKKHPELLMKAHADLWGGTNELDE